MAFNGGSMKKKVILKIIDLKYRENLKVRLDSLRNLNIELIY